MIDKLNVSGIRGFEMFDEFVKNNLPNLGLSSIDPREYKDLERSYKDIQIYVLHKLLNFNYFNRYEPSVPEPRPTLPEEPRGGDHRESPELAEKMDQDGVYQGREKKLKSTKLSKFISVGTDFPHYKKNTLIDPKNVPEEHVFKLSRENIEKVYKAKNHKTYYNEQDIKQQFTSNRDGLLKLHEKVLKPGFSVKELTEEELELLIGASSFSLNSIHFKKKFNKNDYVLSPNDIIYLIKKINSTPD